MKAMIVRVGESITVGLRVLNSDGESPANLYSHSIVLGGFELMS